jgi:hypothetical protein
VLAKTLEVVLVLLEVSPRQNRHPTRLNQASLIFVPSAERTSQFLITSPISTASTRAAASSCMCGST